MTTQGLSRAAPAAPSTTRVLANLVAFQIGWFACVLGGAYGQPWAGTALALTIAVVHLASSARPGNEARLLAIATAIGAAWDSALVALGWVSYGSGTLLPGTAPVWIVAMWKVYTKADRPGWAVIIPIYNIYVWCKIVGRPGWWVILLFIPIVNFVIDIILSIDLARSYGKGAGFGIGIFFLPIIFLPILGFGSATYEGPSAA